MPPKKATKKEDSDIAFSSVSFSKEEFEDALKRVDKDQGSTKDVFIVCKTQQQQQMKEYEKQFEQQISSYERIILEQKEKIDNQKASFEKRLKEQEEQFGQEIEKINQLNTLLKTKIKEQAQEIQTQRTHRIKQEIRQIKRSVVITNVPIDSQALKENRSSGETEEQTLSAAKKFLKAVHCKTNCIASVKRFPLKNEKNQNNGIGNLKIDFMNIDAKKELFTKGVKYIKKSKLYKHSVIFNEQPYRA